MNRGIPHDRHNAGAIVVCLASEGKQLEADDVDDGADTGGNQADAHQICRVSNVALNITLLPARNKQAGKQVVVDTDC